MGYENQDFGDIAGGVSPAFIETLYARFRTSPDSVEPAWRGFFEGLEGTSSGPSWQSAKWPLSTTDDLTAALDPTQMEPAPKPAKGGAEDKIAAMERAGIRVSASPSELGTTLLEVLKG